MAQPPHQAAAAGHYDDGYGQHGDGYYHDDQNQAYYDNAHEGVQPGHAHAQQGEGYYDER